MRLLQTKTSRSRRSVPCAMRGTMSLRPAKPRLAWPTKPISTEPVAKSACGGGRWGIRAGIRSSGPMARITLPGGPAPGPARSLPGLWRNSGRHRFPGRPGDRLCRKCRGSRSGSCRTPASGPEAPQWSGPGPGSRARRCLGPRPGPGRWPPARGAAAWSGSRWGAGPRQRLSRTRLAAGSQGQSDRNEATGE